MKNQHLLAALFLIASMTLGSFGYAEWTDNVVPLKELYSPVSCTNVAKLYLDQDNDTDNLYDFSLYLNSNFILNYNKIYSYSAGQIIREANSTEYTTVSYYAPLFNMLYKLESGNVVGMLDNTTFWRASWAFPYNTPVRGIATTPNQVVFEQPSNNNTGENIVSIEYNYKYSYAVGFDGTSISSYRYNPVPSMDYVLNENIFKVNILPGSAGNRKRDWSSVQSTNSCRNYELHRCGDGVIDTGSSSFANLFTGEICDDGPLNGTPGKCPKGCRADAAIPRCGDDIPQPEGSQPYDENNDGIIDAAEMSFETCDDGDLLGDDGDGVLNGDDPVINQCSTTCNEPFYEVFEEVFEDVKQISNAR